MRTSNDFSLFEVYLSKAKKMQIHFEKMKINFIKLLNVLGISNEPGKQILQIVKWMNDMLLNEKWHT